MILVWGLPTDSPVAAVIEALQEAGHQFFVLDQLESLDAQIDLRIDSHAHGVLRHAGREFNLESIRGIYLRPYEPSRLLPSVTQQQHAHITALNETLLAWSEVTAARVINRPSAMASNHAKPYQSALIHAHGFDVPHTLVTTDAQAVEEFWQLHGQIIYKSLSGVRSIVSRMTPQHRTRFADLATCPTQFQEWIDGVDIRVHVAGDEVFATSVESSATDYRYPHTEEEQPNIAAFDLPADVAGRCRRLAASLSLDLAGIDLRLGKDGRWVCFEVNPSPGFTYYQQMTGQPIAQSIARLLAN